MRPDPMNIDEHHSKMEKLLYIVIGILLGLGASGVSVIGGWVI